jgi:uncharacterized protein YcaQ
LSRHHEAQRSRSQCLRVKVAAERRVAFCLRGTSSRLRGLSWEAERVLERIRADGPLSSHDFERESGPTKDWFGMPENAVRAVLDAYTVSGVIGLAWRDGNLRSNHLVERLLPANVLAHKVPEREQLRHKLLSRYRAHGLLGAAGAGGTFAGIAEPSARNELREELVELGALLTVDVEGVRGKRFASADRLDWAPQLAAEKRIFLTRP